jgi:acetyl esterase
MMLFYPVVTPEAVGPSKKQFVDTPCWDAKSDEKMWKLYLKGQTYVSPLKRLDEFSLEHLYLETCEFDCLKDEGLALYRGFENQVGHKELFETKGTFHGFDSVKKAKISQEAKKRRLSFLSEVVSMWQKEI